jgi:hypothetical protein
MQGHCSPYDLTAARKRVRKQQRRYAKALAEGNRAKARQIEHRLSQSHAVKVVALNKAARKKGHKLSAEELDELASTFSCRQEPEETVTLYFKRKSSGEHRPIFSYGLHRAAQQYMALMILEPRLRRRLHDQQYGLRGRGPIHAVESLKKAITAGYKWVVRADIKNCFPSLNSQKVLAITPGPKAVMRTVLPPPSEEYLHYPHEMKGYMEHARRGIPQGAAPTSLVAAAVLASVLDELPDTVVPINYVDDFAIAARSKGDAADAEKALRRACVESPAGELQLKFCNIEHAAKGFGFLGYHILYNPDAGVIARPRLAAFEGLEKMLDAVDKGAFQDPPAEKLARLFGWRCSFAAWERGDEFGEDSLFAILGHHFWNLEELVRVLHDRAEQVRARIVVPALPECDPGHGKDLG